MDWLKILIQTYGLVEDSDSNIWIGWRFWFKHMDWLNRYICFSTVLCGLLFSIWGMTNDISRKGQFFLENSFPNLLLMKLRTLSKCQSLIFSSRPFFHYSLKVLNKPQFFTNTPTIISAYIFQMIVVPCTSGKTQEFLTFISWNFIFEL